MRVLIVDDEPIVRESMSELLPWKDMGFETVLCARDAYDAQKELELERIDVLISDIEMPGMDGLALSKWVHERFPRTVILLLTCHASFSYAQSAIRYGVMDYLLKPVIKTDLEECVQKAIGKDYMQAAFINGAYYGFPTLRDFARRPKILYNGDLADEYGIDVSNVHTPEDFTAVLAQVKEKIPGIYPIGPVEDRVVTHAISVNYDRLSDTAQGDTCVLLNYGQDDPLKVVNYYETEEYKKAINLVREWYLAGYVYPDSSTDVDAGAAGLAAKKYFCYSSYGHPRSIMDLYAMTQGMDVRELFFDDILALSTTEAVTGCTMCVAATSENPEKALEFINLMYTDPRLVNLLNYGIEGKHWVKVEGSKQLINYPDGVDESNCGYHIAQLWYYGNSLIANIWEDGGRDGLWDEIREFNDTAIKSKALGFAFDLSPVKTEAAAIANVCNEYKRALGCGEVDPAVYIPKFNEALKAAGVDTFIAECQKQLDAWVEAK